MRSKLFVPGSRPELFEKALRGDADAISIDLEDAVADDRKDEARAHVARFLRSPAARASGKVIIVRVNAIGSAHVEADVMAVAQGALALLNLPKAESAADIGACARLLARAEAANGVTRPIRILANIESAAGLRNAYAIASADARVAGLQLGYADLFEPHGVARRNRDNVHAAMFALRMAAAEAGVFAYDGAFPDLRDADGYRAEAAMARQLGFWGKSCIHPSQVALANAAFDADAAELAHAQRVVAAAGAAQAAGLAAFTVDGKMVDPPFVRRAEAIVAAAAAAAGAGSAGAAAADAAAAATPADAAPHAHARAGGPLAGVRVLDLSAYIAGPYGCTLLADMGADVIKVEPPAGDNLRKYPSSLEADSRAFLGVNRSKRGIAIDLKQPEGLAVLMTLVDAADVLVHNFRPGVPERLGIGAAQLRARRPSLVYCAITGYGDQGPMKDHAGYDQVLQTFSGICTLQGAADGPPEIVYGSVVDYYAAALVASGVAAALLERARTGLGQTVGVSLLRSALAMQSARMVWADGEARDVGRDMRSGGITGIHPAREGFLYISANTPHFWRALCERVGLLALADDVRYDSVKKRALHAGALVPQLRAALASRSALEWEACFGSEVPCAAARAIEDMFSHPQVVAEAMVATLHHPVVGAYQGFAGAVRFDDGTPPAPFAAPAFGQHSAELLAAHGITPDEIARLRALGAVL
jgi:crotonobetainyl-CoA:carnitine CoA-transferase CaiB-like acyl-CoA transferase/citrate lyase beta subunit